jgi:uncharacterized RDD family membrane protein YckC
MSKEEHVALTSSDGTATTLADPHTATSPSGNVSATTDTPFGDWREQLRERVKEIRARKHAVHREQVATITRNAAATAVTAEKLETARAQSLKVPRTQPDEPVAEMEGAEPVMETAAEDTVAEAAPEVAPLFQEETTVYTDDPILEIADEFEHRGEDVQANDEAEAEATAPVEATGETVVKAETETDVKTEAKTKAEAATETETEVATEAKAETEAESETEAEIDAEAETEAATETEVGTEAKLETEAEAEADVAALMETEIDETAAEPAAMPVSNNEIFDNSRPDGIPPELQDVKIPAWALPRESSRGPRVSADTDETVADSDTEDVFIVGEYTTPKGSKRTDLGPPPDTPIPTAEFLDQAIGDLSASSEEMVEIAPPGSLVDATDFEPSSREEAPATSRSLPGLFDNPGDEDSAEASKPGLFFDEPLAAEDIVKDVVEDVVEDAAEDTSELAPSEVIAADTPTPVPFFDEPVARDEPADKEQVSAAADGGALEWDIDRDLEAKLVADARRQHVDASAPLSDRVYSAIADGMVLLTIGMVLMIAGASAAGSPGVAFVQAAPIPFVAAWALFGLVYGVIFVGTCGQTLGKMAMRVRVIGTDTFHVGYARAALRALAYAAAALPAGIGLLVAIRDPKHRGMHDRLTGTRVVKA